MATNCHSTCCSILQPYNQIRARRVAHTDPSTCVQTIIHCICSEHNHRCLIISSHLSPVLVSDWSAHPPSSQTHQPVYHPDPSSRTPFGEKPAAVTGPSGDQEQLNSTICMFTEITVLKFTVYLSWSTASLFF